MNAETLHSLLRAVRDDLVSTNQRDVLNQLAQALTSLVNAPQEPSYQQQVSTIRTQLGSLLPAADSNAFPPAWRRYLEEMGIADLLGSELAAELDSIFNRNQITVSIAADELNRLAGRVQQLQGTIDQLLAGFEILGIGSDDLAPGQVELAILIPRDAVDSELAQLGREFEQLKRWVIAPFQELVTGSVDEVTVKTIASSDFSVIVKIAPKVAAALAGAVAFIVNQYKQTLEIRKLRQDMARLEMSPEMIAGAEDHATTRMTEAISGLTSELLAKYEHTVPDARKHELKAHLTVSIKEVARRIDLGYNIQIRTSPPELEPPDEDDGEGTAETAELFTEIQKHTRDMQFLKLEGDPVLAIEPPADDRNPPTT